MTYGSESECATHYTTAPHKDVGECSRHAMLGGDQGQLSDTFTEVKRRRRLALEWVTAREERAL